MKKYINDITNLSAFTDELDGIQCITTGHDVPRYIDVKRGRAGNLGYAPWTEDTYTATYNSDMATGTLDSSKWYAIRLVPVDTNLFANVSYVKGTPNTYSTPRQPSGTNGITFNLVQHQDITTLDTGDETAGTALAATDSSKEWVVDQWVDKICKNVETGATATITANTATVLTLDADLSLVAGDRFQVVEPKTTEYEVYVAEMTSADEVIAATWYLQGYVDYGVTTYDLDAFVAADVLIADEYFPPENFRYCHTAYDRLFAGGGINEARGKAHVDPLSPTIVVGNTSGDDQTYFSQGHVNATTQLSGDATVYSIASVDEYNQTLTLSATYTGNQTTDTDFEIISDYELYYSDVRNPHIFRTENYIEISDRIIAFHDIGGVMVVFCSSSLWAVPLDNLGQRATQITDQIDFNAPYSIVYTPKGLFFWDGYGFSLTDGSSVVSVTKYKANEFLKGVNSAQEDNIRGVYDRRNTRVEYAFAYGNEITNNYGLIITADSLNCYGIARTDVNALWTDKDSAGDIRVYHGTSGRHTASGDGVVWEHDEDLPTDANIGTAAYLLTVDSVTGNTLSVTSSAGASDAAEGWSLLYIPKSGGTPRQMMIQSISSTGTAPQTYDITVSEDFQVDDIRTDDYLFVGGINFDYGVKWLDFGSPQYQHKVRAVNLDTNGFRGILFVDHYLDSKDSPVQTDVKFITPDDTHYTIPVKITSSNTYGMRLRGVTVDKMKLMSMSVMFNTEV